MIAEEGLLLKGNREEVKIKIINKGLSDIRFLEVYVEESTKYDILSEREIYVGDLDSDDFDSVEFDVFFDKKIRDNAVMPVKLKYKDNFNNEYSDFNDYLTWDPNLKL